MVQADRQYVVWNDNDDLLETPGYRHKVTYSPKTYDYPGNVTTCTLPVDFEIVEKSGKLL